MCVYDIYYDLHESVSEVVICSIKEIPYEKVGGGGGGAPCVSMVRMVRIRL